VTDTKTILVMAVRNIHATWMDGRVAHIDNFATRSVRAMPMIHGHVRANLKPRMKVAVYSDEPGHSARGIARCA